MTRTRAALLFFASMTAACAQLTGVEPPRDFEICDNARDDDGDGATDCEDILCAGQCIEGEGNPWELPPNSPGQLSVVQSCTDGVDQDGDGLMDEADPGCWGAGSRTGASCTSGAGLVRTWVGTVDTGALRPLGPDGRTDPYVAATAGTIGGTYGDAPISGRLSGLDMDFLAFIEPGEKMTLALRAISGEGTANRNLDPRLAVVLDGARGSVELRLANRIAGAAYPNFGWHSVSVRAVGTELVLTIDSADTPSGAPTMLRLAFDQDVLPESALDVDVTGDAARLRSGFDDIRVAMASYHPCGQIVPLSGWSAVNTCGEPYLDRGPLPSSASTDRALLSVARLRAPVDQTCVTMSGQNVALRAWALFQGFASRASSDRGFSHPQDYAAVAATERSSGPAFVFAFVDGDDSIVDVEARDSCDLSASVTPLAASSISIDSLIPSGERPIAISLVGDSTRTSGTASECLPDSTLSLFIVTEPRFGTGGAMSRRLYRASVDRESLAITGNPTSLDFPSDTAGLPTITALTCGEVVLVHPSANTSERAVRAHVAAIADLRAPGAAWKEVTVLGPDGADATGRPFDFVVTNSGVGSFDVGGIDSAAPVADGLTAVPGEDPTRLVWFYAANGSVGMTASDTPTVDLETSRGFAACGSGRTVGGSQPCFTCPTGADVSCVDGNVVDAARLIPNPDTVLPRPRDVEGDGGLVEIVPDSGATWAIPERTGDFTFELDVQGEVSVELGPEVLASVVELGEHPAIGFHITPDYITFGTRASAALGDGWEGRAFPREPGWLHVVVQRHAGGLGSVLDLVVTARGTGCELARIEGVADVGVAVSHVAVLSTSSVGGGGIPALVEGFAMVGATGAGAATCNGTLVDIVSDPANCGSCNAVCPPSVACVASACACPLGTEVCSTGCVDVSRSREHCGACERRCGFGQVCVANACVTSASNGETCDAPNFLLGNGPFATTFDFAASGDDEPTLPRNYQPSSREGIFAWQAPMDGYFTFAVESPTCASDSVNFDTVLEVYEGDCNGALIGVSDDEGGCQGSRFVAPVVAGRTYTFVIATYDPAVTPRVVAVTGSFTGVASGNGTCTAPEVPIANQGYGSFYGTFDLAGYGPAVAGSSCPEFDGRRAVHIDPRNVVDSLGALPAMAHCLLSATASPTFLPVQPAISAVSFTPGCVSATELRCGGAASLNLPTSVSDVRHRFGSPAPLFVATALDESGASATGLLGIGIDASLHPFEDCYGGTRGGYYSVSQASTTTIALDDYIANQSLDVDVDYSPCGGFFAKEDVVILLDVQDAGPLWATVRPSAGGAPSTVAMRVFDTASAGGVSNTLDCSDLTPAAMSCVTSSTPSVIVSPGIYAIALALPASDPAALSAMSIDFAIMP